MINKRKLVWLRSNLLCTMLIVVLVLFLANLCMIFLPFSKEVRGTFGDQFGAVNALFSGLAFTGLIYTIILQRRDLKMQRRDLLYQRRELELTRKELEMTRKEMEDQTVEYEKQNETLKIQRFENTFFNMLSQFQEVVSSLSAQYGRGGEIRNALGREFFKASFDSMIVHVDLSSEEKPRIIYGGIRNAIKYKGLEGYMGADVPSYLDHYFRLLYRILKFVKDTSLITGFDDEYKYTSMLRAVLSRYELVWLYYNGLSDYGVEKLKPLIERYAMLKNLRDDLLVDGVDVGSYTESAYGKTIPDEELVAQQ